VTEAVPVYRLQIPVFRFRRTGLEPLKEERTPELRGQHMPFLGTCASRKLPHLIEGHTIPETVRGGRQRQTERAHDRRVES
jgi:hypothetical protein